MYISKSIKNRIDYDLVSDIKTAVKTKTISVVITEVRL